MTTTPTFAVFDLFIGEDGLVYWTPPLIGFFLISEAFFVELEEAPLGPTIIFWVGSIDFARPVNGIAKTFGLFAEIGDVGFGDFLGGGTSLDGIIFGRKAKGVVSEWAQYIETLLMIKTSKNIYDSKITNVSNMKTSA